MNVYVVVAVLLIAGLHVPLIPFVEVVGSGEIAVPEQNGPTAPKVGVTGLLIVMVNVVVVAHTPEFGVKVYVVVAVLLIAGLHVPGTPFVEVVGSGAIASPAQNGPLALKVGAAGGPTVTVMVTGIAH